jgi:DNA-binding CsgD family transcriptional regulator/GAF domain-containing protein
MARAPVCSGRSDPGATPGGSVGHALGPADTASEDGPITGASWLSGYDDSADRVAVVDVRGTIVTVNAAWRAFASDAAGGAGAPIEGASYLDACDRSTGDRAAGAQAIAAAIRAVLRGEGGEVAIEHRAGGSAADRRRFVCRVTSLATGGPPLALVAHQDVTLEKRQAGRVAAFAVARSAEASRLARLAAADRDFAEAVPDHGALVSTVTRRLADLTGDAGLLILHVADGSRPTSLAAYHPDSALTDDLLASIGPCASGPSLLSWRPAVDGPRTLRLRIDPAGRHARESAAQRAFVRRWAVRGLVAVPLVARGRGLGSVALVRCGDRPPFSAADEALLVELADRAAIALDNAWLCQATREAPGAPSPAEESTRPSEPPIEAQLDEEPELIGRFGRPPRPLVHGPVDRVVPERRRPVAVANDLIGLTSREREVLSLVGRGLTNNQIGRTLQLGGGTVKNHLSIVLSKLKVADRVQAAVRAAELGLVARDPTE